MSIPVIRMSRGKINFISEKGDANPTCKGTKMFCYHIILTKTMSY